MRILSSCNRWLKNPLKSGELATSTEAPDQKIKETHAEQKPTSISGQILVMHLCDKNSDDLGSTVEQDFVCFKRDISNFETYLSCQRENCRGTFLLPLVLLKPLVPGKFYGSPSMFLVSLKILKRIFISQNSLVFLTNKNCVYVILSPNKIYCVPRVISE